MSAAPDLHSLTRELHHAAEQHPFMQRMAQAQLSPVEWATWLGALRLVHEVLDPYLPYPLQRFGQLTMDQAAMLPVLALPLRSARAYAASLRSLGDIAGAAYIFSGAHLRGGAVMRRRLEAAGLPCFHLQTVPDGAEGAEKAIAKLAEDALRRLRQCSGAASGAAAAFDAIIAIATEIDRLEADG